MFTKREYQILNYFIKNNDKYITSQDVADYIGCSVRTIKNDIKSLNMIISNQYSDIFSFASFRGKGFRVIILDEKRAIKFIENINHESKYNEHHLIILILKKLISTNSYVSKQLLIDSLHISESTLYKNVVSIKQLLKENELHLDQRNNLGYKLLGDELAIRTFITNYNLYDEFTYHSVHTINHFDNIYKSVIEAFLKYKKIVSENKLANIAFHVSLTISRVSHKNYLEKVSSDENCNIMAYKIAHYILNRHLTIFNLSEDNFDNETQLLAMTIMGHTSISFNTILHDEINQLINDYNDELLDTYGLDFKIEDTTKISLSMHIMALVYRAKSGTQLTNQLSQKIQQEFPLAYDMAIQIASLVETKYNVSIFDGEVSYLSLFFNINIKKIKTNSESKKILIITDIRHSETILIRYRFHEWFPAQINKIDFCNEITNFENIKDYDAIFSTFDDLDKYKGAVVKISSFPDQQDFDRINIALNGYTDLESITSKFSHECFFAGDVNSKNEVLDIVVSNAIKKYQLEDNFINIIKNREDLVSSYFGDFVAIPHPLHPCTDYTFVSTAILDKPILWDNTNYVRFIFLFSFERNNPKTLQFWHVISSFLKNTNVLNSLSESPTFENLMSLLKKNFLTIDDHS